MMELEIYDLIALTETRWYELQNWNTASDGYKLFQKDRLGRRGRAVAVCVEEWIDCEELPLSNSYEQIKGLWVKMKARTSKGHFPAVSSMGA